MPERPIIFSGPMVRAILEGRKTQTRRVVKGRVALEWLGPEMFTPHYVANPENRLCPYGIPGDTLWVRETWAECLVCGSVTFAADVDRDQNKFCGACDADVRWSPSIYMPRWASRITLEVKSVRVERVQDISEADARAEGCETCDSEGTFFGPGEFTAKCEFMMLWDHINAKRGYGWDVNPWVWVVEFGRRESHA